MVGVVQAALLGALQGLTEFLPVSSTAHLLVAERLLGYQDPGGVFTVMIQLGSILAIMWLYRARLLAVVVGLPSSASARRFTAMVAVAVVPAMVAGALLSKYVKSVLYGSLGVIGAAFVLGGIVMLFTERFRREPTTGDADGVTLPQALAVGVAQTLALIPGVSRSGSTMVGGMLAGIDRPAAAEFSFFLAMPTMAAAFAHDLLEVRTSLSSARASEIGIGFVAAFVASAVVVRPFLAIVRRSGVAPVAWYRVAAGLLIFATLAARGNGWW